MTLDVSAGNIITNSRDSCDSMLVQSTHCVANESQREEVRQYIASGINSFKDKHECVVANAGMTRSVSQLNNQLIRIFFST